MFLKQLQVDIEELKENRRRKASTKLENTVTQSEDASYSSSNKQTDDDEKTSAVNKREVSLMGVVGYNCECYSITFSTDDCIFLKKLRQ